MKKYIGILKKTRLFAGVKEDEIEAMLGCLGTREKNFDKGEYVLRQGEFLRDIMVLVKGSIHIQQDDYWGSRSIINKIGEGEMFGEAYLSPESPALMSDAVAVEESVVLFFDVNKVLSTCSSACRFHSLVVHNMFYAVADKNLGLVKKLSYITKRTTREKLMAYLSEEAKRNGSAEFYIPFNRQQLADFLSVDRSAMSGELCKMRDEGLIEFSKNHFRLL